MNTNRIFRLFISSTFSDFQREREALQGTVFPKLEAYCASKGARFQAIDLRWGITELAQNERDTMRICLEEIRRSQQLSPRPNFVVLLGDRYGSEPVPSRIPQTQWKRLMAAASVADRKVIREAFESQPDRNAVPPVYCLKPRQGERSLSVARDAIVRDALRRAATAFEGDEEWLPFFTSATHQEILLGALKSEDSRKHVHVYVRQIDGLPNTEEAKAFIDWDKQTQKPVERARKRLAGLELQLRGKLQERVHDIQARWIGNGISGDHIAAFCDRFFEDHVAIIDRELQEMGSKDEARGRVGLHDDFAMERARNFTGRSRILRRIVSYLDSKDKSPAPLVLHGEGGSGKSAILAHSFMQARSLAPTAVVVARFIGGVPGTESLVPTLNALTQDIADAIGSEKPSIAASTHEAVEAFEQIISNSTPERPVWLFLDALDQFSSDDSAWVLEWLPKHLSPHTRVVVSMREGPVLQAAQRRFPRALLQVPPMSVSEGSRMLSSWLSSSREARYDAGTAPTTGRRLTAPQRGRLLEQFSSSGSPLWLKLAYEDARSWHSWSKARELPHDVAGMVKDLIGRRLLEGEKHMPLFTRRSLAYLAAGRFGLAEEELAKVLGADPEVRDEFRKNEKTDKSWPDSRPLLPPILWSRLHFDLEPYLSEANIDGALLYRFFHREFKEVVEQALLQDEARRDIHTRLAEEVFSKPDGDDLYRKTDAGGLQESTALRRIMEQPWQHAKAGDDDALASILSDLGFCMAKCAANRSSDLVKDFLLLARLNKSFDEGHTWPTCILAWAPILSRGSTRWPAHRILLQLVLEMNRGSLSQRQKAECLYHEQHIDWPVFTTPKLKRYIDRLAKVLTIPGLGTDGLANLMMVELNTLAVWSDDGILWIGDINTNSALETKKLKNGKAVLSHLRSAYPRQIDSSHLTIKRETFSETSAVIGSLEVSLKYAGCLIIKKKNCQIVLGQGFVGYLGIISESCVFICDGNIFLIAKMTLEQISHGTYSHNGQFIDAFRMGDEDMPWSYMRLKSIVFIDSRNFISLGWAGNTAYREDVVIEFFRIGNDRVLLVGICNCLGHLDLPFQVIGCLQDGSLVTADDCYARTDVIPPPFEGYIEPEVRRRTLWLQDNSGDLSIEYQDWRGELQREKLEWQWEGPIGKNFFSLDTNVCEGFELLFEPNEDEDGHFFEFATGSRFAQWNAEMKINFVIKLPSGDYLVIKNSGAEIVREYV